jgi:hypothetical protein
MLQLRVERTGQSVRRVTVMGATLMLIAGMLGQAHATVRGKNGRVAYRRYLNQAQTRGAIFTITRKGTGLRQLTDPRRGIITDEPDWSPNGLWIVTSVRALEQDSQGSSRCGRTARSGNIYHGNADVFAATDTRLGHRVESASPCSVSRVGLALTI